MATNLNKQDIISNKLKELDTLTQKYHHVRVDETLKSTHSGVSFDEQSNPQIRSLASEVLTSLFKLSAFRIPATLLNDSTQIVSLKEIQIKFQTDGSDTMDSRYIFELRNTSEVSDTGNARSFELTPNDIPSEYITIVETFAKLVENYCPREVADASEMYHSIMYSTHCASINPPVQVKKTDVNQVEQLTTPNGQAHE